MTVGALKPFLKWAGGKRWLTSSGALPSVVASAQYIEPFLGSAAVFFHLRPTRAILSDLNGELVHLYRVMRDHPVELAQHMERHHELHARDHYYAVRSILPTGPVARAARFLYLNRTCWNGLYRVNVKGEFNVPIGTKSSVLFSDDDFEAVANTLSAAELLCSDFEPVIARAQKGDVVFADPPYTARHNLNGFLKYNERIFSWADQVRLAECLQEAVRRGASVIVTNANHASVRELYAGVFKYQELSRASVLAASPGRRGRTTEALFTANVIDLSTREPPEG